MDVQNPTSADRDLVVRLHMLVEGLPGATRVKYFRNVFVDVHGLAKGLMLRGATYEAALRQATQCYLPHPNRTNLKLLWHERWSFGRCLGQTLNTSLTALTCSLKRRYQARNGKLWLSRTSLEAISSYKQLQTDLVKRHPDVVFRWSSLTELGPGCSYLGCVESGGRTLYVIAQRTYRDAESYPQTRLALLGVLIEALTHRRSLRAYEAVTERSTNHLRFEDVHNQNVCWNRHEALVARFETNLPDALAAKFETLCDAWWKNQGRPTPLVIEVSEDNYAADLRAMMPTTAMWEAFGVSPAEGTSYTEQAADKFRLFGRVFRLPYVSPSLLYLMLSLLLLPVIALVSLVPTALALILVLNLIPVVGLMSGLLVSSLFLVLISTFIAAVLADRLVSAITLRSPLTTPHHSRERAYVK